MSEYDSTEVEGTDTELETRDVRALRECMSALPDGDDGIIVAGDDGQVLEGSSDESTGDESDPAECACDGLPEGIPCWPCYRDGATFSD